MCQNCELKMHAVFKLSAVVCAGTNERCVVQLYPYIMASPSDQHSFFADEPLRNYAILVVRRNRVER
jgi:hypothetical protein